MRGSCEAAVAHHTCWWLFNKRAAAEARYENNERVHTHIHCTEYQTNGERQRKSGVRSKRECTRTHTHTHERLLRSGGVAAAKHTGGCSTLNIKHTANVRGSAAWEQRWSSHTHTRPHERQSRICRGTRHDRGGSTLNIKHAASVGGSAV